MTNRLCNYTLVVCYPTIYTLYSWGYDYVYNYLYLEVLNILYTTIPNFQHILAGPRIPFHMSMSDALHDIETEVIIQISTELSAKHRGSWCETNSELDITSCRK